MRKSRSRSCMVKGTNARALQAKLRKFDKSTPNPTSNDSSQMKTPERERGRRGRDSPGTVEPKRQKKRKDEQKRTRMKRSKSVVNFRHNLRRSKSPTSTRSSRSGVGGWLKKSIRGFFTGNKKTHLERSSAKFMEEDMEKKIEPENENSAIDFKYRKGINDLHYYTAKQNGMKVQQLIANGRDANQQDERYNSPLHLAAHCGNLIITGMLLKMPEINPNLTNAKGETPLFIAATRKSSMIVKSLLQAGSDASIKNRDGQSVLSKCQHLETIHALQSQIENEKVFLEGFAEGMVDKEALEDVIDKVSIQCKDSSGKNALDYAVRKKDNEKLIKILCERRIDFQGELIDRALPEYTEYLRSVYRQRRREQVVLELLQTEKAYVEDLRLLRLLFASHVKDSILLRGMVKRSAIRNSIRVMFDHLDKLWETNMMFLEKLMDIVKQKRYTDHKEVIRAMGKIEYKGYAQFIQKLTLLESTIKKEESCAGFLKFVRAQEKLIPFPKIQTFESLISKPRFRIIKYRDLSLRMLKYTKKHLDVSLYEGIKNYVNFLSKALKKIDEQAGVMKNGRIILDIHKIFRKTYKMDKMFSVDRSGIQKRKYLCHDMEIVCWDLLDVSNPIKTLDLFLFADMLTIGDRKKGQLVNYFVNDTKMIFEISVDFIRLTIYQRKRSVGSNRRNSFSASLYGKILDLQLQMSGKTTKWEKLIRTNFLAGQGDEVSPGHSSISKDDEDLCEELSSFYYNARIKLLNHIPEDDDREQFVRSKMTRLVKNCISVHTKDVESQANRNKVMNGKLEKCFESIKKSSTKVETREMKTGRSLKFLDSKLSLVSRPKKKKGQDEFDVRTPKKSKGGSHYAVKIMNLETPLIFNVKGKTFETPAGKLKEERVELAKTDEDGNSKQFRLVKHTQEEVEEMERTQEELKKRFVRTPPKKLNLARISLMEGEEKSPSIFTL